MNVTEEKTTVPVRVGQVVNVTPLGKAKADYYTKIKGFILFLNDIPLGKEEKAMNVTITALKEKYGFATYKEE